MKNLKLPFGLLIFLIGIGLLVHTLYGSVFYASTEDEGPSRVGIVEAAGSITPVGTDHAVQKKTAPVVVNIPPEFPVRLIIPTINVKAKVQYVGLNSKGNMGTPNNFSDVAWYKSGTLPGNTGSAVMAGHVDNGLALAGVFKHLKELRPGDSVYVEKKDGTELHFVVESVKSYPYSEIPAAEVFGLNDDGKHLNLITCIGSWMTDQKTYSERLVVYTRLVE
jgi:sortase A